MKQKHDWEKYGDRVIMMYVDQHMSVRDVCRSIFKDDRYEFKPSTITNFLARKGVLRSQSEAHVLAKSKMFRNALHVKNYNQMWCSTCLAGDNLKKRRNTYGLPGIIFERMFNEQAGACKICNQKFDRINGTVKKRALSVDHDHTTGIIRGLLCVRCNTGMAFVDNEVWMQSAAQYIKDASKNDVVLFDQRFRRPEKL